ncbi:MAG: hypothetical protein WB784_02800 [Rhodanobacteraceae bacterium]
MIGLLGAAVRLIVLVEFIRIVGFDRTMLVASLILLVLVNVARQAPELVGQLLAQRHMQRCTKSRGVHNG